MISEPLRPLARPITEFRLLDGNPRRGDVASVKRSLRRFGQRKPIVVRANGTVEAGNTTLKAALELGWTEIAAVAEDDDDATAKAFALADNRTSELGSFDLAALTAMAVEVHAVDPELLEAASFTEADLNALVAGQRVPEKRTDPDTVPDAPAEPVTAPGDVWLLGPHRLLCGDATNPEHLTLATEGMRSVGIVCCDPPYGISIVRSDGKIGKGGGYLPVTGDDSTDTAADAFRLLSSEYPGALHVWWGGNHYAGAAALPDASCWLAWDKENGDRTFADAELAWTNHPGAVRLLRHMWHGVRASETGKRFHPNQKPVALHKWTFDVIDPKSERTTVLDAFAGCGSTLIAAHATWRTIALIEMEAAYCDVICRRYQEHTGTRPVLAATGQPHDFTAP